MLIQKYRIDTQKYIYIYTRVVDVVGLNSKAVLSVFIRKWTNSMAEVTFSVGNGTHGTLSFTPHFCQRFSCCFWVTEFHVSFRVSNLHDMSVPNMSSISNGKSISHSPGNVFLGWLLVHVQHVISRSTYCKYLAERNTSNIENQQYRLNRLLWCHHLILNPAYNSASISAEAVLLAFVHRSNQSWKQCKATIALQLWSSNLSDKRLSWRPVDLTLCQ